MSSFNYSMADVLPLLGIAYPYGKVNFNISCPICDTDGKNQHLNVNMKKNTFRCPRCGDVQGGVLDMYALYMNCTRSKAYKALSDQYGCQPPKHPKSDLHTEAAECELADIKVRNETYRELLSMLSLTSGHKKNLNDRGLTDGMISSFCFKSVQPGQINSIGSDLYKKGFRLEGVPGFYSQGNIWFFRCDYAGFLIPVLDTDGMIQSLQLRLDHTEKRKYRWISSGGLNNGTSSSSFTHFVGNRSETVLLTEGPLKADVINALTGLSVIAIPGVNCLTHLERTLCILKSQGTGRIMTAFDMDFLSNNHVQKGYNNLIGLLERMGFSYGTYLWDPAYKGLDDYICSRKNIKQ